MVPQPIVLGMTICDRVIVEEGTRNVTLVGSFTRLLVEDLPSSPQRFSLFAAFTGGLGHAAITVVGTQVTTDRVIYEHQVPIHFPDRLVEVRFLYRITRCSFPEAGKYQFTLLMDGEWIAQRDIVIAARGDQA